MFFPGWSPLQVNKEIRENKFKLCQEGTSTSWYDQRPIITTPPQVIRHVISRYKWPDEVATTRKPKENKAQAEKSECCLRNVDDPCHQPRMSRVYYTLDFSSTRYGTTKTQKPPHNGICVEAIRPFNWFSGFNRAQAGAEDRLNWDQGSCFSRWCMFSMGVFLFREFLQMSRWWSWCR